MKKSSKKRIKRRSKSKKRLLNGTILITVCTLFLGIGTVLATTNTVDVNTIISNVEGRVNDLANLLRIEKESTKRLTAEKDGLNATKMELESKVSTLTSEKNAAESKFREANDKITNLQSDLNNALKDKKQAEDSKKTEIDGKLLEIAQLNKRIEELNTELSAAKQTASSASGELQRVKEELVRKEADLKTSNDKITALEKYQTEAQQLRAENDDIKQRLAQMEEKTKREYEEAINK